MLSSPALSLFSLSAHSSVVQSGRVTTVSAMMITGANGGVVRGDSLHALQKGTGNAAMVVKSPSTLLAEQMAKVTDQLKAGVDEIGKTLRTAWEGAINRGEITFDPDTSFSNMKALADQRGVLPDGLRAMAISYDDAQKSLIKLRVEGDMIQRDFDEKQGKADLAEYNLMVEQVINDLATAKLVSDSASDGSVYGARAALMLIEANRQRRSGGAASGEDATSQSTDEIKDKSRELALQARHGALVKEIRGMLERGELGIGMVSQTYWGEVDASAEAPSGSSMMVYEQQKDIMTAISVSASLSGGWSVTF